ncbi:MAG: AraC family transcriptional regulator [Armatimonadetes bacterium]|nr:AraC family transcriptional regulator [Armatimonadota bacterium]
MLEGEEHVYYADDFVRVCQPGHVWLSASWEPHGWHIAEAGTRNVVLIFPPEFLGDELAGDVPWQSLFVAPPEHRPRPRSDSARRRIARIGEVIYQEISNVASCWEAVVRLQVLHLLVELSREWEWSAKNTGRSPAPAFGIQRLMPAFALVHAQPWRRVPAAEAAEACGLSLSRFHALFRESMHTSFGRFGLNVRLAYAAHRLVHTNQTVASIATSAGFADDSHFHHCFTEHYGCTPAKYRDQSLTAVQRAISAGQRLAVSVPLGGTIR